MFTKGMFSVVTIFALLMQQASVDAKEFKTIQIPTLGGTVVEVFDINKHNVVVGTSKTSENAALHAFTFDLEHQIQTDLGTFPEKTDSFGFSIGKTGDVVGASGNPTPLHAFYRLGDGSLLTDLGLSGSITLNGTPFFPLQSQARKLNNKGYITGTQFFFDANFNARVRPMFFSKAHGMIDIGTPEGTENADINGMNGHSTIVGFSFAPSPTAPFFATIWHIDTDSVPIAVKNVSRIEGFPKNTINSTAIAINNHHRVVGRYQTDDNVFHAYLWNRDDSKVTDLEIPGNATAQAINNENVVAGVFIDSNNVSHVYAWKESTGRVDIGKNLPAGAYSVRGINKHGVVIVTATDTGTSFAIYTKNLD
jgi:uncharacterized membrane protein